MQLLTQDRSSNLLWIVLVEHILSVGEDRKVKSGKQKPLLTEALSGKLPPEITSQSKKTFAFPFQTWLKEGLASEIQKELSGSSRVFQEWLNPAGVEKTWQEYKQGKTNWARPWSIYIMKKWLQENL